MSKKQFRSQASSSRVASSSFGKPAFGDSSGSSYAIFGSASSALSYLAEQPDLSSITEPAIVVHFKNLSKRDSTTKSKALEELLSHVGSVKDGGSDVEEGLLNAWVGESWARGCLKHGVFDFSHSLPPIGSFHTALRQY